MYLIEFIYRAIETDIPIRSCHLLYLQDNMGSPYCLTVHSFLNFILFELETDKLYFPKAAQLGSIIPISDDVLVVSKSSV